MTKTIMERTPVAIQLPRRRDGRTARNDAPHTPLIFSPARPTSPSEIQDVGQLAAAVMPWAKLPAPLGVFR